MRIFRAVASFLFFAVIAIHSVLAQRHLTPEVGILGDYSEYEFRVRSVLAKGYSQNVVLRAVILPSFQSEQIVGIRKMSSGFEAFVMKPSSRIWYTLLLREYEIGGNRALKNGKRIPLEKDDDYLELKRGKIPSDYKTISTNVHAKKIAEPMATRIQRVWQVMLVATRNPSQPRSGFDGTRFHFSMGAQGYGTLSGRTWSPDSGPAKLLVDLATELESYASGKSAESALESKLNAAEKGI